MKKATSRRKGARRGKQLHRRNPWGMRLVIVFVIIHVIIAARVSQHLGFMEASGELIAATEWFLYEVMATS